MQSSQRAENHRLRSLDEALCDLVECADDLLAGHPRRLLIERMIVGLRAEIAIRKRAELSVAA